MDAPEPPNNGALPHASQEAQARVSELEGVLSTSQFALRALFASTALLRTGTVAAGAAIGFYLGSHSLALYAGLVGASQALAEAFCAPVLARYADRVGRRRFLIAGPLIGGLGSLLLVAASRPSHFGLARILEGVGAAAFIPTALGMVAAVSAHHPKVRARASAVWEAANLAGYAFGFALAGVLWHNLHSGTFVVLAGFYAAAAMVCVVFVPKVPALPVSPLSTVFKAVTGKGPIRSFLPAWMAAFGLIGAYGNNAPALLKRATGEANPHQLLVHNLDERLIGAVLTLWIVLLVAGIFLWVPILTRIGAVRTMRRAVPGAWVMALGILALNHTALSAWVIFLPLISIGIVLLAGFGPAAVTYLAECSETFAADRSALMSFYTVTLAIGGAIGAAVGAFAGQWLQIDGVVGFGLCLSLFAYLALRPVLNYESKLSEAYDTEA